MNKAIVLYSVEHDQLIDAVGSEHMRDFIYWETDEKTVELINEDGGLRTDMSDLIFLGFL